MPHISNDKYETTGETTSMNFGISVYYRIRAKRDIVSACVKAGDLGGWVENEQNLSPEGNCWLFGAAASVHNARVSGNARIEHAARIYGDAVVTGNARIGTCVWVGGDTVIGGAAVVTVDPQDGEWIFG